MGSAVASCLIAGLRPKIVFGSRYDSVVWDSVKRSGLQIVRRVDFNISILKNRGLIVDSGSFSERDFKDHVLISQFWSLDDVVVILRHAVLGDHFIRRIQIDA